MQNVKGEGLDWIRKSAKDAEVVMSVYMGAFLLAEASPMVRMHLSQ